MSIPRFRHHGSHGVPECISEHVNGEWVRYKNHLAAVADALASMDGQSVILASECEKQVAEAEQRVFRESVKVGSRVYAKGYAAALDDAREAVAAVVVQSRWGTTSHGLIGKGEALAAIDALLEDTHITNITKEPNDG